MRAVVITSIVALLLAAVLVFFVVRFASQRPDQVNLGDKRFVVGSAERFAERIASQGTPILLKDPLTRGSGRELYIQHLGDDEKKGWLAIAAYGPGTPRLECVLRWERRTQQFRDPCSNQVYPADGTGLRTYPGKVDDRGAVVIDLRTR
jgi:hypothetical protein